MYKFSIVKTSIWNNEKEILETFKSKDIENGMQKALDKSQSYINNGTVNDYTYFASAILECKNKKYYVNSGHGRKNQLVYSQGF